MTETEKESATTPKVPEKPSKETKPSNEKTDRKNDKLILFAGIPASVLLALIIQYFYHNYYVLPLEERTLFNVVNLREIQKQWMIKRNQSTLHWTYDNFNYMNFEFENTAEPFSIVKGNRNFGHLKASDLLEVKYVFFQDSWKAEFSASPHAPAAQLLVQLPSEIIKEENEFIGKDSLLGNYSIEIVNKFVESVKPNILRLIINPGESCQIQFNTEENVAAGSFSDHFTITENEFDTKFEEIYQLTAKGMPEFYKQMGKSALSSVLSSEISAKRDFEASGFYNSKFNIDLNTTVISSMDMDVKSQILSAFPLVEFSPNSVIKILETWFNLVNVHGNMPSFVENVLDYKLSPVFPMFHLMNAFSEKHGIDQIQPFYKNVEKIGLQLLDKVSSPVSYQNLFEVSTSHTVSVEQHCLMIVASRLLKKLSISFGEAAVAQKFSEFNAEIDNFEALKKTFLDSETNTFRDITHIVKDGKKVPSFTESSTLAPLIYGLIPKDSEILKAIFQDIENTETLWSNYGVRSDLQKDVHLPFNYHLLKALHFYSQQSSSNQDVAHVLYAKLRNNIIMYVAREFKKSNTFWETYSSQNGEGQGRKDYLPSAIVLQVLAELY